MSVNDVPSGGTGTAAAQTDAVLREAQALSAAMDRARNTRIILLVLIVIGVFGGSYFLFYRPGQKMIDELTSDAYLTKLQAASQEEASSFVDKNKDKYAKEVEKLAVKLRPKVQDAFEKQFSKDTPHYLKAMENESQTFKTNLQKQFMAKLEKFQEKAMEENSALIEKEFPAAQDQKIQDRLAANMGKAIHPIFKKYYLDELQTNIDEMFNLWNGIKMADPPTKDQPATEDQFFGAVLDLLKHRLAP